MTERDFEIARKLKNRCSELMAVADFRVFGSRARGDNRGDSDLDIFVEVEHLDRTVRRLIQDTAWEIGLDYSLIIAPVVFSRNEIENTPVRSSPIMESIREEGIAI